MPLEVVVRVLATQEAVEMQKVAAGSTAVALSADAAEIGKRRRRATQAVLVDASSAFGLGGPFCLPHLVPLLGPRSPRPQKHPIWTTCPARADR